VPPPELRLKISPIEIQKVPKQPHRNAGKVDSSGLSESKTSPDIVLEEDTVQESSLKSVESPD
jgi:hypothetical protein